MSLRKDCRKNRGSYLFFFYLSRGENPWFLSHKGHHKAGNTVFEYKLFHDCLHKPCLGSQVASRTLKVGQYKNASLYSVRKERLVLIIVILWKRRLSSAAAGLSPLPSRPICFPATNALHFPSPQLSSLGITGNNLTGRP